METINLLDPGECSHPPDRQHYNGVQKDADGKPLFHLYTCMVCGTTHAEALKPNLKAVWL